METQRNVHEEMQALARLYADCEEVIRMAREKQAEVLDMLREMREHQH